MKLSVPHGNEILDFDCFDNWMSGWICKGILDGETYPYLDFVDGVKVILDVGANCGAASVFLSACYPEARIHAFEPAAATYRMLEANAARRANVTTHPVGLHSTDQRVPLYQGKVDGATASVFQRDINTAVSEVVTLRSARGWLQEQGIEQVDVLKVDVEGCEIDVLESLRDILPSVKLLYVEYDSKEARVEIDDLLRDTHWLCMGQMFLSQGEAVYLANEVLADEKAVEEAILDLWRARVKAAKSKGN